MLNLRLDGLTYSQIAQQAGLSRQRIQQILSPPSDIRKMVVEKYKGRCADCGLLVPRQGHVHHENSDSVEDYQDIPNLCLLCVSCHRRRHLTLTNRCLRCGKLIAITYHYCSDFCRETYRKENYYTSLTCPVCGKGFEFLKTRIPIQHKRSKTGVICCSRSCSVKYVWENGYAKALKVSRALR